MIKTRLITSDILIILLIADCLNRQTSNGGIIIYSVLLTLNIITLILDIFTYNDHL